MNAFGSTTSLKEKVISSLNKVYDPELDEPITDLGFVRDVKVSELGDVEVEIMTSMYWCSPNFIYMMLEDAKEAVSRIEGVKRVRIRILNHFDEDKLNMINEGRTFEQIYGEEAMDNLEDLRALFKLKALRRRLYRVVNVLTKHGLTLEEILALSPDEVKVEGECVTIRAGTKQVFVEDAQEVEALTRYLDLIKGLCRNVARFVVWSLDGKAPSLEELRTLVERGRSMNVNFGFNTALCAALLHSRINSPREDIKDCGPAQQ
ncbi:MAG: iron-sulfur cluster assembly protein [Thaumarchaeota archaeon]|nr:iron-sulfur cluster assembly protein [Candidatus Calditenuaceae archaeon]MDW8187363.1 iron-sulfur cluster assembly protein [Nitrososphaerota archaeon]